MQIMKTPRKMSEEKLRNMLATFQLVQVNSQQFHLAGAIVLSLRTSEQKYSNICTFYLLSHLFLL